MLNWTQSEKEKYINVLPTGVAVSTSNTRSLTLSFDNGEVLTNEDIVQETLSIEKAFCEEEDFHIGNVGAASFSIQIINKGIEYKNTECDVTMTCDGKSVALGHFKITDDVLSDNRIRRTLKGYDKAYEIRKADVTEWYDELYSAVEERHTIKEIRDSFFQHFGINQEVAVLPNDNLSTRKTLDTSNVIKGSTILNAICEINAVFGSFNGLGEFTYKNIARQNETDYDEEINGGTAIGNPMTYKDYAVEPATRVKVSVDDDNIGGTAGSGTNTYAVIGNVFVYDSSQTELNAVASNILEVVSGITFTPMNNTIPFMPWLELGDWIKSEGKDILGNDIVIYTPILSYSLSGIQAAKLSIIADGMQYYPVRTQTANEQIIALRKKSAKIVQEIGEISALLEEQGIYPLFYPALSTNPEVKYPNENLYPTIDLKYNLENEITQAINNMESTIMLRVSEELENYDTHEASLQLWVGKQDNDQIVSMINASADVITLNSNRLIVNSTNLQISANGTISATNGIFSGEITANSGMIGEWEIGEKGLYNNEERIGFINLSTGGFLYGGMSYSEAIEYYSDPQAFQHPQGMLLSADGTIGYDNMICGDSSTGISVDERNQGNIFIYADEQIDIKGESIIYASDSRYPNIQVLPSRTSLYQPLYAGAIHFTELWYGDTYRGWNGTVYTSGGTLKFVGGILVSVT